MGKTFKVGDHARWNSEAAYVSGRIVRMHTKDTDDKSIHSICEAPERGPPGQALHLDVSRFLD